MAKGYKNSFSNNGMHAGVNEPPRYSPNFPFSLTMYPLAHPRVEDVVPRSRTHHIIPLTLTRHPLPHPPSPIFPSPSDPYVGL